MPKEFKKIIIKSHSLNGKNKMQAHNINHTTKVTIQVTNIKCLNEENNEVIVINAFGKLNLRESKQIANEHELTFISKENITNEHELPTSKLIELT